MVACEPTPEGTLELHWSINGSPAAGACAAAEITHVRVLVDNTLADPDADPLQPTWHYEDFACHEAKGRLALTEGIYRVRVVALRHETEVRSQVVELLDVEVIDGKTTSVPSNPDTQLPLDLEVAHCGDGVTQTWAGEWCDASDLGGNTCESVGLSGGELACAADCTFDTTACTECGDGLIDPGEACDSSDLGGDTCESLGFDSGSLLCSPECTLDVTGCVGCGNGTVEPTEECDDGNQAPGDGCAADCRLEQSDLAIHWSVYESDHTTTATCAALGINTVHVDVTLSGLGTLVHSESVGCASGLATATDLGYGLYTVHLSGRDASDLEVAAGSSTVTDHTDPDGTDVSVDLIGL